MIRAPIGDSQYWSVRHNKDLEWIARVNKIMSEPSANPVYAPQFAFQYAKDNLRFMISGYSRGAGVDSLAQYFPNLLDAWELSNQLSEKICAEQNLESCRDWIFDLSDLNHYNWCFWLVGLALVLEISDELWLRLVSLVGEGGQDQLLDRIISSRQSGRAIGSGLLHAKPYARLLKAIDAPKMEQAGLLLEFVEHWYPELNRRGENQLWWYVFGDSKKPLEMGSYFGRWCFEAVAAVKAFGLDDTQCLGHEQYPGDLMHPGDSSSCISQVEPKKGWLSRLLGKV